MKIITETMEQLLSAVSFAEAGEHEAARDFLREDRTVVLVLTDTRFDGKSVKYAVNAAQRNNARLDILLLSTEGEGQQEGERSIQERVLPPVQAGTISYRFIRKNGSPRQALIDYGRKERNILFAVIGGEEMRALVGSIAKAHVTQLSNMFGVPVVLVQETAPGHQHTNTAGKENVIMQSTIKKKPVGRMLIAGIVSVALYIMLLSNQDVVNETFGKGGLSAFLPILIAFIFSFVHGSFTGHFWTVMGIEAARKKQEVK